MPPRTPSSELSALTALRLVGALGLLVVCGALLGLGAGVLAARFVGHPGLVQVIGILLGLTAGIGAAVRMLLKETPWNR
jgi:F0F1-type ATP synthase assembly protein I